MSVSLSLDTYCLMGRSGLRVSPFGLGTMTFGSRYGWSGNSLEWGSSDEEARRILDRYIDFGGNFIDTANLYTNGASERLLGEALETRRQRLVIATKYSMGWREGDPNSGGNHRKSMVQSLEQSLKNPRTDYIDLFYLHLWDGTTPAEEILRAMDDLVRAGKVLYLGISDTPAWIVARLQTMADIRGWSAMSALQISYSLIERTPEHELAPMAREMGLGIVPWSPLGGGS